ncbi:uncharacterized protein C8Q71DRAFT_788195 [Rhodofomes roseus]|uniref:Uncharacterized protein n=1 Tax=Rhodofomes roseus TaxID=34475 RepID=A0ABQ8K028_9APHY|nr:uncharacterized protein C8Q71DRAFT_788195 [Rhodofomes roseus]KAH9829996.1 hypothetical protein C8Q71DRAFT_788195 [Rhodofomes roseus]
MCFYLITYRQYNCGHQLPFRRHYLDCNRTVCKISVRHKREVHDCANECDQVMLADQHLVMERCLTDCDPCRGITTPTVVEGLNGSHSTDESSDSGDSEGESEGDD